MSHSNYTAKDSMRQHQAVLVPLTEETKRKAAITVVQNVAPEELSTMLDMLGLLK